MASTPKVPPAPARFSTTTGWPRIFSSAGCIARATASVLPPAGNGTKKRMDRSGKDCAEDGVTGPMAAIATAAAMAIERRDTGFGMRFPATGAMPDHKEANGDKVALPEAVDFAG